MYMRSNIFLKLVYKILYSLSVFLIHIMSLYPNSKYHLTNFSFSICPL